MEFSMSTVSLVSMSRKSIHISIPTPCHESWDRMDMTELGAFCQTCQKEVIDFSAMTDREVIEYLAMHQTGCGRFRKDQLDTKLTIPEVNNGIFKWKALLLGILPFIGLKSAKAMPHYMVIPANQSCLQEKGKKDTALRPQIDSFNITGKVLDEKGQGLAYANIEFFDSSGTSTHTGTTTDIDGSFSINFATHTIHRVRISYVGYLSQTITISESQKYYTVKLNEARLLGEVTIKPQTPAQKIKYWFRRSFRIKHHS